MLQGHCTKLMMHSQLQSNVGIHVRSSPKDVLNSSVFSCRLSAIYDDDVLTESGRAFQARAAATGNARSPRVVR